MTVDFLGNKTLMQDHEIEKSTMVQEDLPPLGAREGKRKTAWSFGGGEGGASGTVAAKPITAKPCISSKPAAWIKSDSNHATYSGSDTLCINKIARWAIWHIFLTSLNAPYCASKTEKYAVNMSNDASPAAI